MKKKKAIKLTILCMTAMLMFAACGIKPTNQERVLAVFEEHEEVIRERIEDSSAGDEIQWDDLDGVIQSYTYSDGVIEFRCIAEGIVSASVEAGFYYSPDDEPDGDSVGWLHGELVEDGNGYSYSDGTDNRYYTERICENFYYYTVAD